MRDEFVLLMTHERNTRHKEEFLTQTTIFSIYLELAKGLLGYNNVFLGFMATALGSVYSCVSKNMNSNFIISSYRVTLLEYHS